MSRRQDFEVWNPFEESTKPRGGVLLAMIAIVALSLAYSCAHAATITWGCIPSTQDVYDKPLTAPVNYVVLLRSVDSSQLFTKDIQCTNPVSVAVPDTPGTFYDLSTTATNASGPSYPSNGLRIASLPTPVDPPQTRLVVIAPEVYNTGTFDPAVSWLVKRNKLYGTVPLGTLCDESKPAKDGYYRVPTTSVTWANPRAKTSYPLAKCERRA